MALIRINPTKMLVGGDKKAARNFLGQARSQLEILKNQMSFQKLSQGVRRVWLNEDVYVECKKIFNYQECKVWVRPLEEIKEEIITGFILIVSSQSEQEAFAWNLIENEILTTVEGDPMEIDTLEAVKDFVKEYIRREEYEGMLDDSDIEPKQLKPSDTYYESWWTCDTEDTPETTGPFVSTGYSWPEYGEMMDWPEYYTLDQNKSDPDDFVCEGTAKFLKKVDRFVPYLGVTIGHDPAFYHNSGETFPLHARGVKKDTYDGENTLYPKFHWMTPYLSYQDPDTEVELLEKGALIYQKKGEHHITQGIIPPEIEAKCDGYSTDSVRYDRSLFWFHSVFGTPACIEAGCYAATQLNLDLTTDILFDSWDADCHYSLLEHSDTYISCAATSWPFMDFGITQNDNGAVVFEFCVVCWGLASESLTWDERYLSADTGERKQIFRLWTAQREQLGVLADAIWQAHNVIRDAQDLQRFSINAKLIEAAQRHADDLIANDLYGHVGSDGSSVRDRAEDANYLLWKNEYQFSNVGENVNKMDVTSYTIQEVMDEWVASHGHYLNIIHEDFTEIGIGIASNGVDILFVVVFGVLEGRWPGFSPVDTTGLLAYMNSNFVWSGDNDHIRVPKLFLV